jgi:phosphate acetyltransferase
LAEKLITFEAEGMTPKMFQYNLVKEPENTGNIVLPEGNDDRIIMAAAN